MDDISGAKNGHWSHNGNNGAANGRGGDVLDLLCAGFGPAGISLAAALADWQEAGGVDHAPHVRFLERNAGPAWQPGLLVRGTDINHNFLRDFATPRDPRSRFTFVNYLKQSGRLYHFGHLGGRVARTDWDAYVRWTAGLLADYVSYSQTVESVTAYPSPDNPDLLLVKTQNASYLTRAMVFATGPTARVPELFRPHVGERVFHSAQFLQKIAAFDRDNDLTFTVVGSGQSAGEVVLHLYDRFANANFLSLQRGLAFPLVDVGHFSNEVYFPEEVEYFHALPPEARRQVVSDFHKTNYSAVDTDVSQALYWRVYEDKVLGTPRVRMVPRKRPVALEAANGRFRLDVEDVYTREVETLTTDVVILCTGYDEALFPRLLEPLRPHIVTDSLGGPEIGFDYRVQTAPGFRPLIYINGISERTHGASDSLSLSMSALKAERILSSFLRHSGAGDTINAHTEVTPRQAPAAHSSPL
ncbi:SidA/IucD/PvdA family monooxygenase [Bradyrhizobium sp. U87765 SZCCT0131]|uniref:SidA/IucD/PvdA family monooxygenase n=1 Tax=unclassified Bradyrhizobium TaxID=2631580 RepID=UPI001BAD28F2|nr:MULTISPECIES: SidA/IucD/PvdA family monooxygenase [unclassified Bradyrhizobium]MBR1218510.1 SidA/IucD/PvdA family monooxygenase [Bradyrhizobium sp. U87765 SZCCT0131]MBR1260544.1 SidA/IucD/PvdA family monooxygenase [Bradyrhizobium sp. U87765 SZCCT0134]MBR1304008.1 SidA/IucD/PvdA family monooxygenase [Bradyrhizobium sp. U87765 SZCCT0110]MBR1319614.1 SidA/IucD/PvdA family monooxygenase [Bradyrhizobium sp. U87765 SZCCT0109]MBR1347939.1 SidA/IucD/PvdA family monooxygenase [Bradyrhizobium sp. U87